MIWGINYSWNVVNKLKRYIFSKSIRFFVLLEHAYGGGRTKEVRSFEDRYNNGRRRLEAIEGWCIQCQ